MTVSHGNTTPRTAWRLPRPRLTRGVDVQYGDDDMDRETNIVWSGTNVLHERRDPRAAGIARQILAESHSVPLRLNALTALGDLGREVKDTHILFDIGGEF